MIELELTYLAKCLPENLKNAKSREIIDIYFPKDSLHPCLRLRKNGNKYEITKKCPVTEGDASAQKEQTIILSEEEFNSLKQTPGKKVAKIRYFVEYGDKIAEFDVFQEALTGLVLIDFEFPTEEEKEIFEMPDLCLADVTQEQFIAGGMLCGKEYKDIEEQLNNFNYKKLFLD